MTKRPAFLQPYVRLNLTSLAPYFEALKNGDRRGADILLERLYTYHIGEAQRKAEDVDICSDAIFEVWDKLKDEPAETLAGFHLDFKRELRFVKLRTREKAQKARISLTRGDTFRKKIDSATRKLRQETKKAEPDSNQMEASLRQLELGMDNELPPESGEEPVDPLATAETAIDSQRRYNAGVDQMTKKERRQYQIVESVGQELYDKSWPELFELLDWLRESDVDQAISKKWLHTVADRIVHLLFDEHIGYTEWSRILDKFKKAGFKPKRETGKKKKTRSK
jgi:hypothetical protein